MIRLSHKNMIAISGGVWLAIGSWLLPLGLRFLTEASKGGIDTPLLSAIAPYFGGLENGVVALVALALFIGYFKGQKVLGKSAIKGTNRILTLPNPAPITQMYTPMYYVLIGSMVLLGMSIKWLGLSLDIRGFVDVAIGSALINGAMVYFRQALLVVGGASGDLKGAKDLLKKD